MLLMTETCPNCGDELTNDNAAGGLCGRCLFERGIEFTSTLAVADGSTPGSQRFTAPDPVEVEADLLSFDVLELIGQGGMGAVYKAYQRNLDRTVAIKILPRRTSGGHEFAERFAREARALARLRHEHIVMAYDYGLTDRYLYSVMEYVGGPNLRDLLSPPQCSHHPGAPGRDETSTSTAEIAQREHVSPRLTLRRALEIARDICAALQYAHDHGVVHRDIKPENVLLDEAGRVKIADFGLAKLLQPDPRELALTHTRHFMGTLHYMAPEQCERPHETDHRADIYSLGVVLYEMLTGELPIGRFDPPSMRANVDPRIDDLVLRALEKDPARRYSTAAEFGDAIEREFEASVATGLVPAAGNPSPLCGEVRRGAKPQALNSSSVFDLGRFRRGPLNGAGFMAFLVLAYFGWQFLLKYQRDKDGNTTLTVEAKGADDKTDKVAALAQVFKLKSAKASEIVELLQKVFGKGGTRIEADERSNSIIAMADSDTMTTIAELLKALDQSVAPPRRSDVGSDELKARREAIDRGDYPEALLMDEIKDDPRLVELRNKIKDVEELYERARSVAKYPTDPAALRYAARFKTLKEAEDKLIAELREVALLRLRWGTGQSRQTKGIVESTQTSPGGQTKIFSLRNSRASEVSEAVRKLYPEGIDYYMGTDTQSNSLVATGDPEKVAKVEAVVRHLDARAQRDEKAGRAKSEIKIFSLQNSDAAAAFDMLRKLYPDSNTLRMTVDNRTNSLIAEGDRETLSKIEAILLRLDESKSPASDSGPTKIQRGHVLRISVDGSFPDAPIDGLYNIDLDGYVNLGAEYGKVKVAGLTADQAQVMILIKLHETLSRPKVVLSIERSTSSPPPKDAAHDRQSASPVRIQKEDHALRISAAGTLTEAPIDGLFNLDLDGYVNLGAEYGKIKVAGMTAEEVQAAVLAELRKVLREPKVTLTIEARDQATARPPIRITAQIHRDDRMLRVPFTIEGRLAEGRARYSLVAKGPRIGRIAFDVTPAMGLSGYGAAAGSGEGVVSSNKRLSIPSGEAMEVFIEETKTLQGAKPVRVSNIVNLTWDLPNPDSQKATESRPATDESESLSSLELQLPVIQKELAKTKAHADQKEDEIFALTIAATKSGKDVSDASKMKLDALKREKNQLVERVTKLEKEIQSRTARIQEIKGRTSGNSETAPATRPTPQEQFESRQRTQRELQEQLNFIEQQLGSQIPNAVDTLESKILKQQRDELQHQIIELQLHGPMVERVRQPVPGDPLANHPELVQMRRHLGELNAKIAQERFRQEGAKESAYVIALKSQSQRLQNEVWELEKLLRP